MKAVCLDFDGVIHDSRTPWQGFNVIPDPPVPGAFAFIRELLTAGFDVYICSCRFRRTTDFGDSPNLAGARGLEATVEWFKKHGAQDLIEWAMGPKSEGQPGLYFVIEKPVALLYIDDRGFHFEGQFPTVEWCQNFRTWTEKI